MRILVSTLFALTLSAGFTLMTCGSAQAQQYRSTERPYDPNEPIAGLGETDPEVSGALARATPEERRADAARTTALNLGVLNRDRSIEAANADAQARYRQAQADYERRQAQWQADVAACYAGDRARCTSR